MCAAFMSRHTERDLAIPQNRKILLDKAVCDLTADPDVLAIYLTGSLAKANADTYSDIDLHTVVKPEKKAEFIANKRKRAGKWGEVLFYEDPNPYGPVVVTHFASFVKIDSWYHVLDELDPSIWLKNSQVLYDPHTILQTVIMSSSMLSYKVEAAEVERWKAKVLAFAHETYRAVRRDEMLHAESHLDRIRWFVVSGWYMEMNEHFDASYGSWSKVEGKRSKLTPAQLSLLESWRCDKQAVEMMNTLSTMVPEIRRLNAILSTKSGIEAYSEQFNSILEMSY